jgi:hypothetical protein
MDRVTGVVSAFAAVLLAAGSACAAGFAEAKGVWHKGHELEVNEQLCFRGVFEWREGEKPVLKLASSNPYRVTLNGEFAWYGPARGPKGFFRVDEVALSPRKGGNLIEIECAGYNCPTFYFQNQPSFLEAELSLGGKVLVKTAAGGVKNSFTAYTTGRVKDVKRYSHARSYCEVYDLPWKASAVELAETPPVVHLPRIVSAPDFSTVDDFEESAQEKGFYVAPVNRTGFPMLSVECIEPGELKIEFDEYPIAGDFKPARSKVVNEVVWRIGKKGKYELEAFEPYVLKAIKVSAKSGSFKWSRPRLRLYRNSDSRRASFKSSDPALDLLFAAAEENFAQNSVDGFMDCPGRERAGWNCDAFFTSRASAILSGNLTQETIFIDNFAKPEHFDNVARGMIPMCYPSDFRNGNFIPSWAMFFVLQLDEYRRVRGGDPRLAEELRPRVFALVDFIRKYRNSDGLLEKLPRWVFVEWSRANDFVQDVNYPNNMIWAATLEAVDRLYGRPDLAEEAARMKETIRRQSWTGEWFCDNSVRQADGSLKLSGECSETCQYYAFYFGTATKETHPELYRRLTEEFGPERVKKGLYTKIHGSAPFIGNFMRLDWLGREGLVARQTEEVKGYFSYMAERTGTLWENADSADNGSCCHGFASHVAVFIVRDIVGLKAFDAGSKTAVFTPPAGVKLDFCALDLPVGDGMLKIGWKTVYGRRVKFAEFNGAPVKIAAR